MVIDFTKNSTASFLEEEADRQSGKGQKRDFFKWREGRHNLRFLTFEHVVNDFDIAVGRFPAEHKGQTVRALAVPVERVFIGIKPNTKVVNCLPDREQCPVWQRWFSPTDPATGKPLTKEEAKAWRQKNKKAQPKPYFLVNAIDTDHPEQGVHVIAMSRADWLGPRSNTKPPVQTAYGIYNALMGYEPRAEKKEEQQQTEAVVATAASASTLPAFEGFYSILAQRNESLFGLNGYDVIVYKANGNFGVELDPKKGIALRPKAECLTFKEADFKAVDIYQMPSAFPGYVSGKDSKPLWETATNFVAFVDAQKQAAKNPGAAAAAVTDASAKGAAAAQAASAPAPKVETATPTVAAPSVPQTPTVPAVAPAPIAAPAPAPAPAEAPPEEKLLGKLLAAGRLVPSNKRKVVAGMIVRATDTENRAEGYPEGATYFGRVTEVSAEEVTVDLKVEDQANDVFAAQIAAYHEQGVSEFFFKHADVKIYEIK